MKCVLCNQQINVSRRERIPSGLLVAPDSNRSISIDSPCIHLDCLLDMKRQLDQLTTPKENK